MGIFECYKIINISPFPIQSPKSYKDQKKEACLNSLTKIHIRNNNSYMYMYVHIYTRQIFLKLVYTLMSDVNIYIFSFFAKQNYHDLRLQFEFSLQLYILYTIYTVVLCIMPPLVNIFQREKNKNKLSQGIYLQPSWTVQQVA